MNTLLSRKQIEPGWAWILPHTAGAVRARVARLWAPGLPAGSARAGYGSNFVSQFAAVLALLLVVAGAGFQQNSAAAATGTTRLD